jgi:hypothetical protein
MSSSSRRAFVVAALVAAAACALSQPNVQLAIVSGKGGSLAAPSIIGIYKSLVTQLEYDSLVNADPAFFSQFGFPVSVVNGSGVGQFAVDNLGNLAIANPGSAPVTGEFRLYVCDSKNRGRAQTVGTFSGPPEEGGGGGHGGDGRRRSLLQAPGSSILSQVGGARRARVQSTSVRVRAALLRCCGPARRPCALCSAVRPPPAPEPSSHPLLSAPDCAMAPLPPPFRPHSRWCRCTRPSPPPTWPPCCSTHSVGRAAASLGSVHPGGARRMRRRLFSLSPHSPHP